MTPTEFIREMDRLCANVGDLEALALAGENLMKQALGENSHRYLPGVDAFCRRLRELKDRERRNERVAARMGDGLSGTDGAL